jgi:hypothetical protein
MSEHGEHQTNYYFDLFSGQLLIGDEAYTQHVEAGGNPADVIGLSEFIRSEQHKSRPMSDHLRHTENRTSWTKEEILKAGEWLLTLPRKEHEPELTQDMLERAARIGLIAGITQINNRFDDVSHLYKELNLDNVRQRGMFRHWEKQDYISYLRMVMSTKQQRSIINELQERSSNHEGPSPDTIRRSTKTSITNLLEAAGYLADMKNLSYEDHIDWGIKFMMANDGRSPDTPSIIYLSSKKLAPTRNAIYENFGSFPNYQDQVTAGWLAQMEKLEMAHENKLLDITEAFKENVLPASVFEGISKENLIRTTAIYRLVSYLFPDLKDIEKKKIINKADEPLESIMIMIDPTIKAGAVETTALLLGVFDDIWPMDDYLQTLRIAA